MMTAFLIFFGVWITWGVLAYSFERRQWNQGVSPTTGDKWIRCGMDSQGGRQYKDSSSNYIWISWPGIDKS